MIRISEYNKSGFPYESAVTVVKNFGDGDLLKGMKAIKDIYLKGDIYTEDKYAYEFNAYNAVFAPMSEMFHGKAG